MHKAILDYSSNVNGPVGGVVTPEALELLVGVKYMRALACPGEAVGCVAAQSIGACKLLYHDRNILYNINTPFYFKANLPRR